MSLNLKLKPSRKLKNMVLIWSSALFNKNSFNLLIESMPKKSPQADPKCVCLFVCVFVVCNTCHPPLTHRQVSPINRVLLSQWV